MTDQYYGWAPTLAGFAGGGDDYVADQAAQSTPYEPTQWDGVTIEQMWEYARRESDERTVALAETWRRTSILLQSTRENLKRHADGLRAKWRSPAGELFMSKVGAALYSLDEWKDVADKNANGLEQIASKIAQTQRDMRELWLTYQAEQKHQAQKRKADEGIQFGDIFGLNNGKSYTEVQKEFHERAKNIVKPLAELYIDVYISNISRGGKYKGPTKIAQVNPGQPPRPAGPNAPGGLRPPAPTALGGRPEWLARLDVTPSPSSPELSDGIGLAGGTVTAPSPTPGPLPAATPPISPTPVPAPLPPPVLRGVSGPGAAHPTTPSTTRPSNAPRTTLPGANNPDARGPAPNRPAPPNTGKPGGSPAHRGPTPNQATLPGNTGTGRPPTGSTPPRPTPPPPNLSGKHSTSRAASGPRTSSPSVGRPAPPPTTGRPTPPNGGGPLTGRTTAGGIRPAPTTGPAPSLGGRRGAPTTPRPLARARPEETENWKYGEGDDELWVTDPAPAGTIDAPAEHQPRHHGKALGQG